VAVGFYETVFVDKFSKNVSNVGDWLCFSIAIFDDEIEEVHDLFLDFVLSLRRQFVACVFEFGYVSPEFSKVLFFLFVFSH
jgi:hypothetical protein